MKKISMVLPAVALVWLAGCGSAKKSSAADFSADSSVADTLSLSTGISKFSRSFEIGSVEVATDRVLRKIDFVDSGGEMQLDSNGRVTMRGVRSTNVSAAYETVGSRKTGIKEVEERENTRLQSAQSAETSYSGVSSSEQIPDSVSSPFGSIRLLVALCVIILIYMVIWRKLRR